MPALTFTDTLGGVYGKIAWESNYILIQKSITYLCDGFTESIG